MLEKILQKLYNGTHIPRLTDSQIQLSVDIFKDSGQVFFGSIIIPYFLGGMTSLNLVFGTIMCAICWGFAFFISKNLSQHE